MERLPKYEILTEPRAKAFGSKEQLVIEQAFKNQVRVGEDLAEIEYQPEPCHQKYRVVMGRKNLNVKKGEPVRFAAVRYFFYLPHRKDKAAKIVGLANGRCDQENVSEPLKHGVNALRMPVHDLLRN